MNVSIFAPAILTFFLSFGFSFLVLKLFPKISLLDRPQKYGLSRAPIPYPAGVAPIAAFLISLLLFFPPSKKLIAFLIAIVLVAAVSFWDDRRNLPAIFRLAIHFLAASLVAFSGVKITFLGNPFGDAIALSDFFRFLPEIVTIFWLVFFANVMNWLDGVPGLSAASAAAAGLFLGILSLTLESSQLETAKLAFVFSAAAAGFLLFNIPPAKMLLGDTGAMTFGFIIAAITVFSGGKMATAFLVLAIPFLDAVNVIFSRILAKKNPLRGADRRHLHDRLADAGFSDRSILLFFLGFSVLLGWLSLQFQTRGKILLIFFTAVIFLTFSRFLGKIIRKKNFKR